MTSDPQLHHIAKRITVNSLEKVLEVFGLLGCKLIYRPRQEHWAMITQKDLSFNIQLVEVDEKPTQGADKISSHIAFISRSPAEQIRKIEKWAVDKRIKFEKGAWSEKELWFDLPNLFVDFVIEVMHVSILEE